MIKSCRKCSNAVSGKNKYCLSCKTVRARERVQACREKKRRLNSSTVAVASVSIGSSSSLTATASATVSSSQVNRDKIITTEVTGILDEHGQGTRVVREHTEESVVIMTEEMKLIKQYRQFVKNKRQRLTREYLEETPWVILHKSPILMLEAAELKKSVKAYIDKCEEEKWEDLLPDNVEVLLARWGDTEATLHYVQVAADWVLIRKFYRAMNKNNRYAKKIENYTEKLMAEALYNKALYMTATGKDLKSVIWPRIEIQFELERHNRLPFELDASPNREKYLDAKYKNRYVRLKEGMMFAFTEAACEKLPREAHSISFIVGGAQHFYCDVVRLIPPCLPRVASYMEFDLKEQKIEIPTKQEMLDALAVDSVN